MNKYFLNLPTQQSDSCYSKDYGCNEKLAYQSAQIYFDADEEGRIELVEKQHEDCDAYIIRLLNPQYLVNLNIWSILPTATSRGSISMFTVASKKRSLWLGIFTKAIVKVESTLSKMIS